MTNPYAAPRSRAALAVTVFEDAMNRAAEADDFRPLGVFRDPRGPLYSTRSHFWLSPDREILALIEAGMLAGIPVRCVWLSTRTADGRCLVTLNNLKGWSLDLGGLTDEYLVISRDFDVLVGSHRKRLAAYPAHPLLYSEHDPLGDSRAFRARRTDRLESLGYARYLGPERDAWRYTLKGALVCTFKSYLRHLTLGGWTGVRKAVGKPG